MRLASLLTSPNINWHSNLPLSPGWGPRKLGNNEVIIWQNTSLLGDHVNILVHWWLLLVSLLLRVKLHNPLQGIPTTIHPHQTTQPPQHPGNAFNKAEHSSSLAHWKQARRTGVPSPPTLTRHTSTARKVLLNCWFKFWKWPLVQKPDKRYVRRISPFF